MTETKKGKSTVVRKDYEEPNYWKTICACVLIILILTAGYLSYKKIYDKNKPTVVVKNVTDDEKKFKKEYERYNDETNSSEEILKKVSIPEDNNIKYVSLSEAVDLIKKDQGVLFLAYPTNQKSRIVAPILVDVMNNTDIETLYYLNVRPNDDEASDIRDIYTVNKKRVQKSKDADEEYYELLKILDKYLPKYTLTNQSGDVVNTGEKRLSVPTLISFNKGSIGKYVEGTVENHDYDKDGILRELTKEETRNIYDKYTDLVTDYLETGCLLESEDGC